MRTQNGVITEMEIQTRFRLVDVLLFFGRPARGGFDLISNVTAISNNAYPAQGFRAGGFLSCPVTLDSLWNSRQTFVFFSGEDNLGLYDPEYLSQFLRKFKDDYTVCWER